MTIAAFFFTHVCPTHTNLTQGVSLQSCNAMVAGISPELQLARPGDVDIDGSGAPSLARRPRLVHLGKMAVGIESWGRNVDTPQSPAPNLLKSGTNHGKIWQNPI